MYVDYEHLPVETQVNIVHHFVLLRTNYHGQFLLPDAMHSADYTISQDLCPPVTRRILSKQLNFSNFFSPQVATPL